MSALSVESVQDARHLLDVIGVGLFKIRSWAGLTILGYPTLAGVVVLEWDKDAASTIENFASSHDINRLLFRSDAPRETGVYPRGGYELPIEDVEVISCALLDRKRTPYFLEPCNPFEDYFSLGLLLWPGDDLVVEVVGRGFDASDLKRGDLSPHERFHLSPDGLAIRDHWQVSQAGYRQSKIQRLAKIGRLYGSHPDDESSEEDLAEAGEAYLRATGYPLLLESTDYEPVSLEMVESVAKKTTDLPGQLQGLGLPGAPLMISMTYWGPNLIPVYWDVVWPRHKYEGADQ